MNSRQQPIFNRQGNGATAKPPVAKPAPAPAVKKEPPKQDVLLRLWAEQGKRVTVHFRNSSELAGKILQVETCAFSLLIDSGPVHVQKGGVLWVQAVESPSQ